jgi:hypothetical protein
LKLKIFGALPGLTMFLIRSLLGQLAWGFVMALEMHVFFHGTLPRKAALSRTLKELGLPLALSSGGGPLEQHKGLLPMRLRGEETGVEFDITVRLRIIRWRHACPRELS